MTAALLLLCLSLGEEPAFTLEAGTCPSLESLGALYRPREAERGLLRDSLDRAASLDPFGGFRAAEGARPKTVSSLLESLGTPLDRRLFVGVTIDLFGPEDVDGPAHLDARQAAPRIHYLSTGLGLRFKL